MVIERVANLSNAKVQSTVEINERFLTPDCSTKFLTGNRLAGAQDEAGEHLCGLRLQAEKYALTPQFSRGEVEFKQAESKAS
jgi:hypothetical protein